VQTEDSPFHRNCQNMVKRMVLLGFFLLFLEAGFRTPLDPLFNFCQSVLLLPLLFFFFMYVLEVFAKHRSFASYEVVIFLLLLVPFWGAFSANRTFGQPLIYGILAARDFFSILAGWYIYYLLRRKRITLSHVRKALLAAAWFCLTVFYLATFFLDARKYSETSLVSYSVIKGGYILHFNIILIVFGFIYYFIRFFNERRKSFLVFASLFFSYVIVREGRLVMLTTAATAFLYYVLNVSLRRKITYSLIALAVAIPVAVAILGFSSASFLGRYQLMFGNAFAAVLGQKTGEASTNARIYEFVSAEPYIKNSPLAGNGQLSHHWHNGYDIISPHFFPSDIGIFGVVYIYGFIGTVLIFFEYLFAFFQLPRIKPLGRDSFIMACKYFLLQSLMESLGDGNLVFVPAATMIIIGILYYAGRYYKGAS
jgi:hypothetical protein